LVYTQRGSSSISHFNKTNLLFALPMPLCSSFFFHYLPFPLGSSFPLPLSLFLSLFFTFPFLSLFSQPSKMKEPEALEQVVKHCYHCKSSNNRFAYFNNSNIGQPRYKCMDCLKFFTFGSESNCPKGRKYSKKRGVDPEDIRDLPRQCPNASCGETKDTPFRYYNNDSKMQTMLQMLALQAIIPHEDHHQWHKKIPCPQQASRSKDQIHQASKDHQKKQLP
jgi:hypothetical protein